MSFNATFEQIMRRKRDKASNPRRRVMGRPRKPVIHVEPKRVEVPEAAACDDPSA